MLAGGVKGSPRSMKFEGACAAGLRLNDRDIATQSGAGASEVPVGRPACAC